jgi:hypothetical protein
VTVTGRPWRGGIREGQRCRCEDIEVIPSKDERVARRHRFDDPGARPLHAPPAEAGGDSEDIHHHLEAVLQGVLEGMWSRIQDEGILEKCVGVPLMWWAVVRRAAVVGAAMTGRLSPGLEGPVVGGAPLPRGGAGGGVLEAP